MPAQNVSFTEFEVFFTMDVYACRKYLRRVISLVS
jgi:hypothetical protein